MIRAAIILGLAAIVAIFAVLGGRSSESADYRVDAIFDTAKGIVPGQLVKIAGAKVGKVTAVELAPGPAARLELSIEDRFEPFREDASCRILPEGFISENYVECDPGTARRGHLSVAASGVPTVKRERTAVPVSLQDVINIFSLPVDQRLRVFINELGIATAGRGEDINAILRRSNPALAQARNVLSLLAGQREQLANAVTQTDRVLAELGNRDRDVRRFVDRAATVSGVTAAHRGPLGQAVRRLPPMLDSLRRGLRSLDRATAAGAPLLDDLRVAAPSLTTLTRTLPSFTRAGLPALRSVGSAAGKGRPAVRSARPLISHLRQLAADGKPTAKLADQLLISARDKGGLEALIKQAYAFSNVTGAYDETSHMQSIVTQVASKCLLDNRQPGCKHQFYAPDAGQVPVNEAPGGLTPAKPASPERMKALLEYILG